MILLVGLVVACHDASDTGPRYLVDARFRRDALIESLVNGGNGYSRLRLAHYASGDDGDWDRLTEWNPPVAAIAPDGSPIGDERPLDLAAPTKQAASMLGEAAFFRYPTQLWNGAPSIPALVAVRLADGARALALTCATCHSRTVDGATVPGLANESLDLGWGPGRVDVAPPPGEEPIAIPDLRPVALETNLQRDGTVRNTSVVALAIRIETLIITSHGAVIRPPRQIALGLATWLESLAPAPTTQPTTDGVTAGANVFAAHCEGCHAPPGFAGPPVALDVVGTDPRVGLSADRGTGGYRVPSLRGVATRGRLLHDGSVPDVKALFDPSRTMPGHPFGLDLSQPDRLALLDYLTTL